MTTKKHSDDNAETFYASAAKMFESAVKRRLGFTCHMTPEARSATARVFDDDGQTITETRVGSWTQLDMFGSEPKPEAPAKAPKTKAPTTKAPTTRRAQRVWIRREQFDGCDGATQAELTEPLAGSSIEWETRPEGLTAVVPRDVYSALAELCETLAVDLYTGETLPPFEPTEEPAPVSEAVRWGFDAKTLARLSDEAVAAFEHITKTDFVFIALPCRIPHPGKPRPSWWTCDTFAGPTLRDLLTWRDDFKVDVFEREHTTADDAVLAEHLTNTEANGNDCTSTLRNAASRAREKRAPELPKKTKRARATA